MERRTGSSGKAARGALAFAWLALAGFTEPPVSPEHTLRYTRERGGSCTLMIPYYGPQNLWIGRVAGSRPMDVSAERVFDDVRSAESCFFLEEDCKRWVTYVRSVYSQGAGFAYCQWLAAGQIESGFSPAPRGKVVKP
jgi:hypothetical protein